MFYEPEKVDLMDHVCDIVKPILNGKADVVVPTRNDELFRILWKYALQFTIEAI